MKLSVLMPVYNGAKYLPESLASILGQSYQDFELLVVDDGSTDASPRILESCRDPRLRLVRFDTNRGQTAVLNEGLRLAAGEWIARQDADDVSEPRRLEAQLAFLDVHADTALLGGQGWSIDGAGRGLERLDRPCESLSIAWALLFDNPFLHSGVVFRRSVVLELGGYDPSFAYCQDYALWSRVARLHPVRNLPDQVLRNRAHVASMTRTMSGRNVVENRLLIGANLEHFLGRPPDPSEIDLFAGMRLGPSADQASALVEPFTRLLATFQGRHPEAMRSDDFRALVGRQLGRLAYAVGVRHPGRLGALLARSEFGVARQALRVALGALRSRWRHARRR